jgi:hypothetical protein
MAARHAQFVGKVAQRFLRQRPTRGPRSCADAAGLDEARFADQVSRCPQFDSVFEKSGCVGSRLVSDKLTPSGVSSVGRCIADRRFTNCELLCLRLALELETSI